MPSSVLQNVIQPKGQTTPLERGETERRPITRPSMVSTHSTTSGIFEFGGPETEDMDVVLGVLVENAPVAMAMFDRGMRYILANRQWIAEFGLQQVQPLVGKSQYEIFPGLHPGWRQVYDRALQGHIVRSEHDALSGPDGRAWIYRWEVRPWRKKRDASVGGLMVTCEKFSPARGGEENAASRDSAADSTPLSAGDPIAVPPDCMLPIVVVNEHGVILRANVAAARLTLERGMQEGTTCFWDVFGGKRDFTSLRQLTLETLAHAIASDDAEPACINIVSDLIVDTAMPARWLVSPVRQKNANDGITRQFMLMAQPCPPPEAPSAAAILSAPMAPPAQVPSAPAPEEMAAVDEEALLRMEEELLRARQEHRMLSEAQHAFVQRETRMRSYLEAIPCGVFVLDERGAPQYQNERLTRLLGRPIEKDQTVEDWLAHGCPTPEHRDQVALVWRESVWRRQLVRTISLATADGLLKDLEFNPVSLPGGGLMVSIQDVTEHTRHDEQLRSMEAKLRTLLMGSPVAVILTDKGGVIFEVNQQAETLLGQAKSELRRYPLDAWLDPASATARRDALRNLKSSGRQAEALGVRVKRTDGALVNAILHLAPVTDSLGEVHCTVHYLQEAVPAPPPPPPAAVLMQAAPHSGTSIPGGPAQAVMMTTSTETAVELLLTTDAYGRVRTWMEQARQIFDVEAPAAIGRPLHQFFRPSDATGFFADLALQAEVPGQFVEHAYYGGNGRRGHVPLSARMLEDGGFELTAQIITHTEVPAEGGVAAQSAPPPPAGRATVPLAFQVVSTSSQRWPGVDLEREKLLLTETHHRIKNHLQIISSLLNMQINGVADQDARDALRSSQNRVRAIAALHQHLYQIALGRGDTFSDFTRELVGHLRECYETPPEQVTVRLEIQEGPVQPEWLMPLALTLNEALSNCFEHAFPHGRQGQITATLAYVQSSGELTVTDDGIGLLGDFRPDEGAGLGLKILAVFAEQMRGQLFVKGTADTGTEVRLRFPLASNEG